MDARKSVLVIDDEPIILSLARRALTRSGFDVLEASDGAQAIHLFREHRRHIAAVLVDQNLPDIAGLELVDQLRHFGPEVRIVLCSGQLNTEDHMPESVDGILGKPFGLAELIKAVFP